MTYRSIRVSDEDRESVAGQLGDAYVAGRLDRAEFDERCAAAYAAKTWGQLSDLTADLPSPPLRAADLPAGDAVPAGTTWGGRKGAGRPRVALLVVLLVVLGLLIAAPSLAAAVVMSGVLAVCVLGCGMARR
jgi:uncharacterized protein DUF1707